MEDIKTNKEEFVNYFRAVQEQNYTERYYDHKTNRKHKFPWNKDFKNFNHINSYYYKKQKRWQEKDKEGKANSLNNKFSNSLPVYQKLIKTNHKRNSRDINILSDERKESSKKQDFSDMPVKLLKKLRTNSVKKTRKQSLSEIDHHQMDNSLQDNMKQSFNEVCNKSFSESKVDSNFMREVECKARENAYKRELQKSQMTNRQLLNNTQISLTSARNKSRCTSNNMADHFVSNRNKKEKISQNLITELMTMPKENLKKIISDPKIHPKFEIGMEQLVNESRLLLAQKFRNLAESKMSCQGQILQSQLVNDIGTLIDTDLAVDVCQLPPELIKQIGDMFQLDFGDSLPMNMNENSYKNIKEKAKTEKQNMEYHGHDNSDFELLINGKFGENTKASEFTEDILLNSTNLKENIDDLNFCFSSELQNHVDSKYENFQECNQDKTNFNETDTKAEFHSESDCTDIDKRSLKRRFMGEHMNLISKKGKMKSRKNYSFNECSFSDGIGNTSHSDINCDINVNNDFCEKSIDVLNQNEEKLAIKFVQVQEKRSEERDPNLDISSCSESISKKLIHDSCALNCAFHNDLVDNHPSLETEIDHSSQIKKYSYSEKNKTSSIFETKNDVKLNSTVVNNENNVGKSCSTFKMCDDECKEKSAEAQTNISLIENQNQGVFSHFDDTEETLLIEINEIDNFVHRLNQKKFFLFLKLLGLSNYNSNLNAWRISLLHNVTNGDTELMNKLSKNLNVESK